MKQIYFEAKGEALLERIGMTKSEFARQMGIRKQNVKALFKSKNLETIYKAASVLNVPLEMLVGYVEEPNSPIPSNQNIDDDVITEYDIPNGDSTEDRRLRHRIILSFYHDWKKRNPEAKKYNFSLEDDINIRYVSLELRMSYNCPGLGMVKMMVGVKHSDKSKVQYCITAINTINKKQEAK